MKVRQSLAQGNLEAAALRDAVSKHNRTEPALEEVRQLLGLRPATDPDKRQEAAPAADAGAAVSAKPRQPRRKARVTAEAATVPRRP